ncbi:MAG: CBS domain-containing protein [Betaproteobacteria bacterium]|nr:CBS domain-containing protein [Betaproteobacteria bacterium]MBI2225832.1 CBS domain-containing protein [Betaproteobacteria bacterium]MBI2292324.1 CBS domain-containing protein [Betaproteobacteria bacterium]MBI3053781.1 CBS domain-containing protein [Betaproteobacteria bacterium]
MPRTIRTIIEDREPLTAPAQMTVGEAARLMKQSQYSAVMVVEDGKLAGIFTERDALFKVTAEGRDAQTTRLSEVMTRTPHTIHPDKPFADALHLMHVNGFRHVPVVEDGRPIGMVSARDALGPELEDVVYEWIRQEQVHDILA